MELLFWLMDDKNLISAHFIAYWILIKPFSVKSLWYFHHKLTVDVFVTWPSDKNILNLELCKQKANKVEE